MNFHGLLTFLDFTFLTRPEQFQLFVTWVMIWTGQRADMERDMIDVKNWYLQTED